MRWRREQKRISVWHVGVAAVMVGLVIGGVPAFAEESSSSPSNNVALQVTSWVLTVPYGAFKSAYALGGSLIGGIVWVGTGGDTQKAKSIWQPAITGDYIIRPENLAGQRPLHFVGKTE